MAVNAEFKMLQVPVNVEDDLVLKRYLENITNKLNSNYFFTYPQVTGYSGTAPLSYLQEVGAGINSMLEAAVRVDALSGTVKNYVTQDLTTQVLQNADDLAVVAQQFSTFYDDTTAAAWYGLTVKSGELISGFTVGGVDTDTTTPGTAGSFFAISADKFTVGRALEDIDDPAELAYLTANNLPYGTMYSADLGQVVPAFLVEWNGTSYDIIFNGKVSFTNLVNIPSGSTPLAIYRQSTTPESPNPGDVWFNTSDNNLGYQWDGSTWLSITQNAAAAINANTTTINGAKITTGSITANQIAADTIVANNIAAGTITAAEIASATITGNNIASNTIDANSLKVGTIWVSGIVQSSNFTTIGGAGFRLKSEADSTNADPDIYGAYIRGGTIDGMTINASTINIRNLNMVNDAGKALLPIFFATSAYTYTVGAGVDTFYLAFDMYTYDSGSASLNRFIGTTGTIISFSKVSDTVLSAPVGYISLVASDYSLTALDLYIKVGTTTLASKTDTWATNTVYSIGGLRFAIVYNKAVAYDYTFCLLETSNDITLSSTSSSPITIQYSCDVASMTYPNSLVVQAAVSNL